MKYILASGKALKGDIAEIGFMWSCQNEKRRVYIKLKRNYCITQFLATSLPW